MEMHNEEALARQRFELRRRMLEIDKDDATWRCEQYRRLLERFGGDAGSPPQRSQPESGQPITGSSSSQPATPSGPIPQRQQVLPSVQQDDSEHGRHQGTSAPSELVPPGIVRRNDPRRELFAPGIIVTLCADNSPHNRSEIFGAAGLFDHQLTPREAAWASKTPKIPWRTFTRVFGGVLCSERPLARRVPAYADSFLCTGGVMQPFAPTRVGEPGLILFPPDVVLLEDTKDKFHVLVDSSVRYMTELRYCGVYTKVQTHYIMEVQPDEWYALPEQCRAKWLKRIWRQGQGISVTGVQARCCLRQKLGSEPSPAEIEECLQRYHEGTEAPKKGAVASGFNSGVEKFRFEVIKCVGYDTKLAKLIRNKTNRRPPY